MGGSAPLMADRHVLLTGASRGIGAAIALHFAREGASLYLCARSEDSLVEVAKQCREQGAPEVHTIAVDMLDSKSVTDLAQKVGSKVDTLVNNAGMVDSTNALDADPVKLHQMVQLNLVAPMLLTHELGPHLADKPNGGIIINLSSVAGRDPIASQPGYAASKWGLTGWSLSTFEGLREKNIKVVAIFPALVSTDMTAGASVPQDHMISPNDIAEAALLPFRMSRYACPTEIVVRNAVKLK